MARRSAYDTAASRPPPAPEGLTMAYNDQTMKSTKQGTQFHLLVN